MSPNLRSNWRALFRILVLFAWAALAVPAVALEARIERVSGEVELGRGAPPAWQAAKEGMPLVPGDALRTGSDGRAELVWQGATIRLYGDSVLRLPEALPSATGVELDAGTGLFDVEHRTSKPFEVRTPEVVVSVKGTRFSVSVGGGPPEVAVYRGVVGVRARALALEHEVLVRKGFRAVGGGTHPAELFLLEVPDPWTHWGPRSRPPEHSAQAPASPAKRAVDEAREAGRAAIRARALPLALERHPELADRLEGAPGRSDEAKGAPAGDAFGPGNGKALGPDALNLPSGVPGVSNPAIGGKPSSSVLEDVFSAKGKLPPGLARGRGPGGGAADDDT